MTRKDYILIAAGFQAARIEALTDHANDNGEVLPYTPGMFVLAGIDRAIEATARQLRSDNPRFDTERFYTACGFMNYTINEKG